MPISTITPANRLHHIRDEKQIISDGFSVLKYCPRGQFPSSTSEIKKSDLRLWTAHFQANPNVCRNAWNTMLLRDYLPNTATPMYLFWALYCLKSYATEDRASTAMSTTRKTLRKRVKEMVEALTKLSFDLIKFENRLRKDRSPEEEAKRIVKVSVDCTDMVKEETFPFDSAWSSHKFGGSPAFKYELAVSAVSDHIVWANGPFKAGKADVSIFRNSGLKMSLIWANEMAAADSGYAGDDRIRQKYEGFHEERIYNSNLRARQESVNQRIKNYGCMSQRWRQGDYEHFYYFRAVLALVQLEFEHKPLMRVNKEGHKQWNYGV